MVITSVAPRKTLVSKKWLRRNDSSSISTVLHPDEDDDDDDICQKFREPAEDTDSDDSEPRRITIISQPQHIKGSHRIYKAFCPDCYCKSFPVAPSMGRPRDACCCKTSQEGLKPRRRPITVPPANPKYTKRRQSYEDNSQDYFMTLKERLDELERDLKLEEVEIERKKQEYRRIQERGSARCYEEESNPGNSDAGQSKFFQGNSDLKLKDLQAFRKEHYFDCHSGSATSFDKLANSEKTFPPQCFVTNCLHKINLTPNLKLQAENPDQFGTSRCHHCKKSLSEGTLTNPPISNARSLLFAKNSLENLTLRPIESGRQVEDVHSLQEHLQDKMFLTTRNNEQLEVTLPHNFLNEVQKPQTLSMLQTKTFRNFKMPVPADSMALRFQKGMINKTFGGLHRSK